MPTANQSSSWEAPESHSYKSPTRGALARKAVATPALTFEAGLKMTSLDTIVAKESYMVFRGLGRSLHQSRVLSRPTRM